MTTNAAANNGYPRVLDEKGCIYGRGTVRRIEQLEETMDKLNSKLDKIITSSNGALIGLAVSAILLALNLLIK